MDALKNNKEREALNLLKYNPFSTISWDPDLERALKRILAYRKTGTFKIEDPLQTLESLANGSPKSKELHAFFQQLEELASEPENALLTGQLPEDLHELLLSKEAFSATFLAAGWMEAGLQLHALPIIPDNFPDWVAYSLTQALHQNRSNLEALEFATIQKPTPELSLLSAELMIAGGDTAAALEKLNKLNGSDSDIGYRAAWLSSLIYIENKKYKNARNVIYSQPRLVKDILGQETLARIALLEGDTVLADKLYTSIVKKSPEARSYLARRAFMEKDWSRARELTKQLIQDFPEKLMLKKNLRKIIEEEEKQETVIHD